jgi:hypothetical protein
VGNGTIWALPAFEDNASALTLIVSRLDRILETMPVPPVEKANSTPGQAMRATRDVFVSHASEDKDEIARPLVEALRAKGITVWFDEYELNLGDSLPRKIEQGLRESRHGLVIMSKNFFQKEWPKKELGALFVLESSERRLMPVWHKLTIDDVKRLAPLLADRFAISTDRGIPAIVAAVTRALG